MVARIPSGPAFTVVLVVHVAAVLLGALTLAVAVAGAMAPAASAQTNLLANGGFSAGSTSGWTCSASDTVVTSPAYDSAAYALSGTPADSGYAECSQVVSVQPSSSYTLAGWVEGDYVYLGAGRADRTGLLADILGELERWYLRWCETGPGDAAGASAAGRATPVRRCGRHFQRSLATMPTPPNEERPAWPPRS